MRTRQTPSKAVENRVLIASRRRCCLCVYLEDRRDIRPGQIAHLNRDPRDASFENLVWLCLEHHDAFDTRTSQSKGFSPAEVRHYRDRLYRAYAKSRKRITPPETYDDSSVELPSLKPVSEYEVVRSSHPRDINFTLEPWRYALWQVANQSDLFAYKAGNRADGVCLIERIDLPDGRIVIACIAVRGNPGQSVTNCVEELCFQVCERFEIPPNRLVWLEHYDFDPDQEWSLVTFEKVPPEAPFTNPTWVTVTPELWHELRLRPKKRLPSRNGTYGSKLVKLFPWPTQALV